LGDINTPAVAALRATAVVQNNGNLGSQLDKGGAIPLVTKESYTQALEAAMSFELHPWLHSLSMGAIVTTIALQLSPMPSCLEIRREHNVKRYDGYPYFTVLAGATQWVIYGFAAAFFSWNPTFLTMCCANAPGVGFGVFYVTNFRHVCPKGDSRSAALDSYLLVGAVLLVCQALGLIAFGSHAVYYLGLLGSVGSAQIALSPYKTLPEVIKTQSTRSWPIDLCLWNFIQSMATGGFGFANNDPWVWVPNVIGVLAAIGQFVFIGMFWKTSYTPIRDLSSTAGKVYGSVPLAL